MHSTLLHSLGSTRFRLTNTRHYSGAPLVQGFHREGEKKGEALGCAVLFGTY